MDTLPAIIGIVGPIRAGKTTATDYLVEKYGYISASNSDVLKRILIGMGITPTRTNLALLGNSIFEVLGDDIIARYRLDNLHLGRVIIDGIRYPDELKRYSEIPNFRLLGVTSDSAIRFKRTLIDSDEVKDRNISEVDFNKLGLSRSELNVPELISKADATISNMGSIEDLHSQIDAILKNWST